MNIIITGGAGFIGSHLCEFLLNKGDNIICVDNLGSGDRKNIKEFENKENFVFIEFDITKSLEEFEKIIEEKGFGKENKIHQIYHLASRASPNDYQEFPVETALSNSLGLNNMIKLSMKHDAVVLFSSTSEAYGQPKVHPQPETYWGNVNPVGIRSCYDESKRFGEALMMAYHRKFKAKVKIIRIFNTYGPKMRKDDGRVIPNFIQQALNNEEITIYGNGEQTRSFCYVTDLVEGIVKMMNSAEIGPKNLGNPREMTILECAQKVIDAAGSNSKLMFNTLPEDDPTKRQPDISSARQFLDWEPKIEFEEGIKKTIEWFKEN
jgi:dTDP-glucose 4,6-dehydratase